MKPSRFAQESAAQAQAEAQQSEPEKPKLVTVRVPTEGRCEFYAVGFIGH